MTAPALRDNATLAQAETILANANTRLAEAIILGQPTNRLERAVNTARKRVQRARQRANRAPVEWRTLTCKRSHDHDLPPIDLYYAGAVIQHPVCGCTFRAVRTRPNRPLTWKGPNP